MAAVDGPLKGAGELARVALVPPRRLGRIQLITDAQQPIGLVVLDESRDRLDRLAVFVGHLHVGDH